MSNVRYYREFFSDPGLSDEDIRKCVELVDFVEDEYFERCTSTVLLQHYVDNLSKCWWPKLGRNPLDILRDKGVLSPDNKVQEWRDLKVTSRCQGGKVYYFVGPCPLHKRVHNTDRWSLFVWNGNSRPGVFCKGKRIVL